MEENKTVVRIQIPDSDHSTFPLQFTQSKSHCVWIDWGDGSERDIYDELEVKASHEYSEPGSYDIVMFAVDEATIEIGNIGVEHGYKAMVTALSIGDDVTCIGSNACIGLNNLETLTFFGDETNLSAFAFADCSSLESVSLPGGLGMLSEGTLFGCSSLKHVMLPTVLTIIGANAFSGCGFLEDVNFESIEKIEDNAFQGCKKLKTVKLGNKATEIADGAFAGCLNIREIELGSAIANLGDRAFCDCQSVTKITIPSSVKTIGEHAFYNCRFLREIKIEAKEPPVLRGANAFPEETNFQIIVPHGARRVYAKATNWAVYADVMKEESL